MVRKQVTQVYLKGVNEKVIVSLERGQAARAAMANGSGVWIIPEQNNRTVDAKMIGEVNDVWVEDVQVQLGEQLEKAKRLQATGQKVEPTATSPGYIKFLLAQRKFVRKRGGKMKVLTDDQRIIIEEIEEREAFQNKQKEDTLNAVKNTWANAEPEERQTDSPQFEDRSDFYHVE